MTVGKIINNLNSYLYANKSGRYYNKLYLSDGNELEDATVDSVYYRSGEIVLQSNETDNGDWSLIIPYIIHCLKFFQKDLEVCVQVSDEDLDYEYFDADYTYVDSDGDVQISCSSR